MVSLKHSEGLRIQIRSTHGDILGYFVCIKGEWILELELHTTLTELREIFNLSHKLPKATPFVNNDVLVCLKANCRNKLSLISLPIQHITCIQQMDGFTEIVYTTHNKQLVVREVQDSVIEIERILNGKA